MEKRKHTYQICRRQEAGQEDKYAGWPNHEPKILQQTVSRAETNRMNMNRYKSKVRHFSLKEPSKRYRIDESYLPMWEKALQA